MRNILPSPKPSSLKEQGSEKEKLECYVLNSYAIFALSQREEGHEIVAHLLLRAERGDAFLYLSLINWGEILYILERDHGEAVALEMVKDIDRLPIILCDVNRRRIAAAAHVKARYPVSYADAFAIALAQELGATVLTGDPEFKKVEDFVPILWLRAV
jgi:ribonuclease VapC